MPAAAPALTNSRWSASECHGSAMASPSPVLCALSSCPSFSSLLVLVENRVPAHYSVGFRMLYSDAPLWASVVTGFGSLCIVICRIQESAGTVIQPLTSGIGFLINRNLHRRAQPFPTAGQP